MGLPWGDVRFLFVAECRVVFLGMQEFFLLWSRCGGIVVDIGYTSPAGGLVDPSKNLEPQMNADERK
jgi:hypothetical protein